MQPAVQFIGGELDGQCHILKDTPPRYRCPYYRPPQGFGLPPSLDQPLQIRETEYVLTRKGDRWFYVESELMRLSEKEGIDPRDGR